MVVVQCYSYNLGTKHSKKRVSVCYITFIFSSSLFSPVSVSSSLPSSLHGPSDQTIVGISNNLENSLEYKHHVRQSHTHIYCKCTIIHVALLYITTLYRMAYM